MVLAIREGKNKNSISNWLGDGAQTSGSQVLSQLGHKIGGCLRSRSLEIGGVDTETGINNHQLLAFGNGKLEQKMSRRRK